MERKGILGKKLGMTQVFSKNGKLIPVTVVEVEPNVVTQIKTTETDGYDAIQLGFDTKREKLSNKAEKGHLAKANTAPKRFLKEIRGVDPSEYTLGQVIAADTFRAAAQEQLDVWAKRINVDIVSGKNNSDPSSVLYDGLNKAKDNYDLVIIDTAGRLQNKVSLMNELSKMRRVISKLCEDSIVETFLVLDATTGQNGVSQAKSFFDATGLTGIIITKMDGTSKGGIILSIKNELGIPVRFIGLGEKIDDLQLFDLEKYLYGLCVVNDKDE